MNVNVFLTLLWFTTIKSIKVMTPDRPRNPYINIVLTTDPRKQNSIVDKSKWVMKQISSDQNPLQDWYIVTTLDKQLYGFDPKTSDSTLSITIAGATQHKHHADFWFAFSIDDTQFMTFGADFDSKSNDNINTLIYPACGSNLAHGNPSNIIPTNINDFNTVGIKNALSQGNGFSILSNENNGNNWPFTFEFVNNVIDNTFTFRFISNKFPSGLQCVYNGAVKPKKTFKMYAMLDQWSNEYTYAAVEWYSVSIDGPRNRAVMEEDLKEFYSQNNHMLFGAMKGDLNINKMDKDSYGHRLNVNYNPHIIMGISLALMFMILGGLFVLNQYEQNVKKTVFRDESECLPLLSVMDSEDIDFDMDNL